MGWARFRYLMAELILEEKAGAPEPNAGIRNKLLELWRTRGDLDFVSLGKMRTPDSIEQFCCFDGSKHPHPMNSDDPSAKEQKERDWVTSANIRSGQKLRVLVVDDFGQSCFSQF